ncbi:MAG: toll/interleukin-1 receptor domain-containing protein [Clostridia bacterium]|nr:toll/interleukin-1 receptor domain-containing protein [Clostridia bacterium]
MADTTMLNCQTCGGALNVSADGLSAVCPYCGNEYHFKSRKGESLSLALNRANLMRLSCDFDGAITEYTLILSQDNTDAEANWGLALSRYGIEYVKDSRTDKLIPTCRRTVKQGILQDENYLAAVKYSDPKQAELYTQQAKIIDRLQREIKRKMSEEDDFDVFICYRSADENGNPTRERTVARRIYDELTSRGIKTFFSEVTLNGRIGDDYEPIIYKALYSCKFFILVALSEENINTPWVKNEWSRYRDRQEEEGISGACCAVFEGSALNLPPFMRSVQGVNLAKYPAGGYEIEIADNLCTRLGITKAHYSNPKYSYDEKPEQLRRLLNGAQADLNAEIYGAALEDYQKIVDLYPDSGDGWWGCFLASQKANSGALAAQKTDYIRALSLKTDINLINAERYGDGNVRAKISSYKKMCRYRCGELAAESKKHADDLQGKIQDNNAALAEIAKKKQDVAKKREKCARFADKAKYNKIRLPIIFVFVFMFLFFVILSVVISSNTVFLVFIALFALCALCTMVGFSIKRSNSVKQAEEFGRQVAGYFAQEQALNKQNEELYRDLSEAQSQVKAFSNVFN